ncbi:hypothetical protein PRIPAC_97573 [Pristionchus pacificus]|uniref:Nuclear receptor n=1 Tax=Pristionchus pacificus TaxID=54126 RepID=A0A2A6D2R1_PRIPA|nr:hypothetical protein PRIPAC_97573 [Pristionchus pacificus]|eukprot:PDM84670.1 nuclear receptor [Pristionchus pacificus]
MLFSALACNICANFFRRNVLTRKKPPSCNGGGLWTSRECYSKSGCFSCRLKLCVELGMSAERVRKIVCSLLLGFLDDPQIVHNPPSPELVVDRVLANLRRIDEAFDRFRSSTFNPHPASVCCLEDVLSMPSKLSVDYGAETWPTGYPDGYTDSEGSFLDNIFRRIRVGLARKNYEDNRKSWYFCNVLCAIEYFKTSDVCNVLSMNTRRVLAGRMASLISHLSNVFYSMRSGKSYLVFPDGVMLLGGMQRNFPEEMENTAQYIEYVKGLQLDENEFALLKVLLSLSPILDDATDSERALVMSQSECYAKILFSYVMARRGKEQGPRSYQEMLAFIQSVIQRVKVERDIQVFVIGMYMEMCPLLAEIISI